VVDARVVVVVTSDVVVLVVGVDDVDVVMTSVVVVPSPAEVELLVCDEQAPTRSNAMPSTAR